MIKQTKKLKKIIVLITVLAVMFLSAFIFSGCEIFLPINNGNNNNNENDGGEWTNDNAVYVGINQNYVNKALQDGISFFAELDLKAAFITEKYFDSDFEYLRMLLVLNGGKTEQEAAIVLLRADERVGWVSAVSDVPFETVNTLSLLPSANTLKVGETITIKPQGSVAVYLPNFVFDEVIVTLKNYNPNKTYTVADFKEVNLASLEWSSWGFSDGRAYFTLKLAEPGYFNAIKAVHALSLNPNIQSAFLNSLGYPCVWYPCEWEISDTSVADFVNKEPQIWDGNNNVIKYLPIPNENDEIEIKGLKPGTVTITYMRSLGHFFGPPVSLQIAVVDACDDTETNLIEKYQLTIEAYVWNDYMPIVPQPLRSTHFVSIHSPQPMCPIEYDIQMSVRIVTSSVDIVRTFVYFQGSIPLGYLDFRSTEIFRLNNNETFTMYITIRILDEEQTVVRTGQVGVTH